MQEILETLENKLSSTITNQERNQFRDLCYNDKDTFSTSDADLERKNNIHHRINTAISKPIMPLELS